MCVYIYYTSSPNCSKPFFTSGPAASSSLPCPATRAVRISGATTKRVVCRSAGELETTWEFPYIPDHPWCWYIYLQNWDICRVNVGRYTSTMDDLGYMSQARKNQKACRLIECQNIQRNARWNVTKSLIKSGFATLRTSAFHWLNFLTVVFIEDNVTPFFGERAPQPHKAQYRTTHFLAS